MPLSRKIFTDALTRGRRRRRRRRITQEMSSNNNNKRRRRITEKTPNLPDIPDEIILDILVRLPVKSLCRFRCVSKPWRTLISTPNFTKMHHTHSTSSNQEIFNRQRLFICTKFLQCAEIEQLPYYEDGHGVNDDYGESFEWIDYQLPKTGAFIVGSCRGLVCFYLDYDRLIVLNPSTRQFNQLPHPGLYPDGGSIFAGIGFDEFSNDYKVVKGVCYESEDGNYKSVVNVYSMKTRTWRPVEPSPPCVVRALPAVFVSGCIHWKAEISANDVGFDFIISFDVKHEKFGIIWLPETRDRSATMGIGVLEGCLCAVIEYKYETNRVYKMKEYGVDSWINVIELPEFTKQGTNLLYPLCFTKDGRLIMHIFKSRSQYLSIYSFKEEVSTNIALATGRTFQVAMYVESLVSPYGLNGEEADATSI